MKAGWRELGSFWFSRAPKEVKRCAFMAFIVSASQSALASYAPSRRQYAQLDVCMCAWLRRMEQGRACSWVGDRARAMSSYELLRRWRLLPARFEDAVRRVRWLQDMLRSPEANQQVVASLWGSV